MLGKLAYRNAKRSIKDYLIYLITITLSFSLILAFNLVASSDEVAALSSGMSTFQKCIDLRKYRHRICSMVFNQLHDEIYVCKKEAKNSEHICCSVSKKTSIARLLVTEKYISRNLCI